MPTSTAYVIGFDFGTNSCRAVLMRADGAAELAVAVFAYPSGDEGVLYDLADAHCARQHPADYLLGVRHCVASLIEQAQGSVQGFRGEHIRAIGFGTTGSTVIPTSDAMVPLGDTRDYEQNLAAQAWLWKDHTSDEEARLITARLSADRPDIIARCGGIYSPEWFWAKILHLRRTAPQVFADAGHFVELCEFLPLALSGASSPAIRSACALGHKALYSTEWGGLPDATVLAGIDPDLAAVAARMSGHVLTADQAVGTLTDEWADLLGVSPSVVLAGGAFDAHVGAVGAGIKPGRLIKVMGTSTCDIMISREDVSISGVCGVVRDSVIPGYFGIEAGQSAVGDLFKWFAQRFSGGRNGSSGEERLATLTREAAALRPGQSGLVALDWNNGNRSILVDMDINGLIVGQTLQTDATEIFRALMEATAFGALTIIEQVERSGVAIDDIVCCGGLAHKNPLLMQIYADVTGRPISTAGSSETCAKGAAIFAAAAAGLGTVEELRDVMVSPTRETYTPDPDAHRVYRQLFDVYTTLHDAFGRAGSSGDLFGVMKTLNRIRRRRVMDEGVLSAVLAANRRLPECGLVTLTWGNVSGRDPATGLVAIKPSGVAYDLLALEDLVIVDLDGTVRHGSLRPSSDTATHLELYRRFPAINGIVHTHSRCATVLCQIGCDLPVLGTTHADHFDGTVPLVRALTHDEVAVDYELYTGRAIADHFEAHSIDPMRVPAALQHHHAPFAWATSVAAALDNAIALEVCAEMALMAISAGSRAKLAAIPDHITRKHQDRKHGPNATYGQK